ncbi:MAG: hypothetical protein ACLFWD_06215 [Anaerolineales bacterium]
MFKFFGKAIGNAASQILKQANTLEEQVMSPVNNFVKQLQGNIWTGSDADKFAEEIERDLMPKVQNVIAAIAGVQSPFGKMSNAVSSKDKNMMSMAQNLGDVFDSIF